MCEFYVAVSVFCSARLKQTASYLCGALSLRTNIQPSRALRASKLSAKACILTRTSSRLKRCSWLSHSNQIRLCYALPLPQYSRALWCGHLVKLEILSVVSKNLRGKVTCQTCCWLS